MMPVVKNSIHKQLTNVIAKSKSLTKHNKVSDQEVEELKNIISNLSFLDNVPSGLSADEIMEVIDCQNKISTLVTESNLSNEQREILMRSFLLMAQQLILFEMNIDIMSAKAAFIDQLQLLWPVAFANVKHLIEHSSNDSQEISN
jgi:hypothetical protein